MWWSDFSVWSDLDYSSCDDSEREDFKVFIEHLECAAERKHEYDKISKLRQRIAFKHCKAIMTVFYSCKAYIKPETWFKIINLISVNGNINQICELIKICGHYIGGKEIRFYSGISNLNFPLTDGNVKKILRACKKAGIQLPTKDKEDMISMIQSKSLKRRLRVEFGLNLVKDGKSVQNGATRENENLRRDDSIRENENLRSDDSISEIKRLKAKIATLEGEKSALVLENGELKEKLGKSRRENERLMSKNQELEKEKFELTSENQELQSELESLRAILALIGTPEQIARYGISSNISRSFLAEIIVASTHDISLEQAVELIDSINPDKSKQEQH